MVLYETIPANPKGLIVFAIELTEDNFTKIRQTADLTVDEAYSLNNIFFNRSYVFITGYTDSKNRLHDWAILPMFIFADDFEFDPEKIKNDWDQVFRLTP